MKPTTSDAIFNQLRDDIITGTVKKGEVIQESTIAERFGISKITARETLQRLCTGKYLTSYPRKGYLVHEITDAQVTQIQQVRYQLESLALRRIISKCTDDQIASLEETLVPQLPSNDPYGTMNTRFHLRVAELCGNTYLYDTLFECLGPISRYAITSLHALMTGYNPVDTRHREIIHALLERNTPSALYNLRLDLHLAEDEI